MVFQRKMFSTVEFGDAFDRFGEGQFPLSAGRGVEGGKPVVGEDRRTLLRPEPDAGLTGDLPN